MVWDDSRDRHRKDCPFASPPAIPSSSCSDPHQAHARARRPSFSASRARWSRDRTVPTGTPSAAAIDS